MDGLMAASSETKNKELRGCTLSSYSKISSQNQPVTSWCTAFWAGPFYLFI
jgi:hypothetical protein